MTKDLETRLDDAFKRADKLAERCDKCGARNAQPVVAVMPCGDCSNVYRRCAAHDGLDGCKRSLQSHKPLCFGRRKP